MSKIKFLSGFISSLLFSMVCYSQSDGGKVDMADTMRSNGRIFVVVAVVVVILIGLILYIVRLDKKISRLEKQKDDR
ncbi:MAG: CcmD family protein [Chitinophagales bacterium]